MDYISQEQYAANVDARCSKDLHDIFPMPLIAEVLLDYVALTDQMDRIKKALFYGKMDTDGQIAANMYYEARPDWIGAGWGSLGDRSDKIVLSQDQIDLFHSILGIATETGELVDAFISSLAAIQLGNKSVDDAFDHINMREEFGDVLWYVTKGLSAIKSNVPECMTVNDRKLEQRYGPTFSAERANERDLDNERKTLEGE